MKIEKLRNNFSPVVVTLESQTEVDILYELFSSVGGGGKARSLIQDFIADMTSLVSDPDTEGGVFFEQGGRIDSL